MTGSAVFGEIVFGEAIFGYNPYDSPIVTLEFDSPITTEITFDSLIGDA